MKIYISPSSQEHNAGPGGYIEEVVMNKIADKLCPELTRHGIEFMRNNPANDFHGHIAESNAYKPNYHLAMHSNAMGASGSHTARGLSVYVKDPANKTTPENIFAQNIYDQLSALTPTADHGLISAAHKLSEVMYVKAPAILVELDYHDNAAGAAWILANIDAIARAYLLGILKTFGIAFKPLVACPYPEPWMLRLFGVRFKGNDARWFQWHLIRAGYKGLVGGKLDAFGTDGDAYTKTWAAIADVCKKAGLGKGAAGAKTRAAIKKAAGL